LSKKKQGVHYVNNEEFYQAIVEYRKLCAQAEVEGKEKPRIPNYIGSCIWKIAQGLSTKPCFSNYSFVDEMIADAVENSILYFDDYKTDFGEDNPDYKPNPFSYFSQIAYFAFLRRIYKEEKNRYTTYKHFQETMGLHHDSELFSDENGGSKINPQSLYDNLSEAMTKFEKKEEAKRAKKKASKRSLKEFYVED
jgi:hypothetical protein